MRRIQNWSEIATSDMRKDALAMVEAAIEAVMPEKIMDSVQYDRGRVLVDGNVVYNSTGRIFVMGGGKAGFRMARRLEEIAGPNNITDGHVNVPPGTYEKRKINFHEADHPTPSPRGVAGVQKMLSLKREYGINANDLVIFLISGGGSALMPLPVDEVPLADKISLNDLLVSNLPISEVNCIRKHVSRFKGGKAGEYFAPAQVVTLGLSDVIGNNKSVIGSGPTYPDPTTFQQAIDILKASRNGRILWNVVPDSVKKYLEMGAQNPNLETPKSLPNCQHYYIIGENLMALQAMKREALGLGYKPFVIENPILGDPEEAARSIAQDILSDKYKGYNVIIVGGETAPQVPKISGVGGRNQHFALASMEAMATYSGNWVVASFGTDGADYKTGAAGAIVDRHSVETAIQRRMQIRTALDSFDSNAFFKSLGNSLGVTGPTGTNVCDVVVYMLNPISK